MNTLLLEAAYEQVRQQSEAYGEMHLAASLAVGGAVSEKAARMAREQWGISEQ